MLLSEILEKINAKKWVYGTGSIPKKFKIKSIEIVESVEL